VRLYRDLQASGLHDYLLKPLSSAHTRDALTRAQAMFAAPRNPEKPKANKHIATAVIGTRGGVGASTIASSLSWLFSTEHKLPTALLDLDIHFGTAALTMDLEPGRGLADAIENPSRIDGLFIERAMIRANDHLSILSAEAAISAPLLTDGSAFMALQEEFRTAFEMSVIDMPRSILINFPNILGAVNLVVVVTELTLAGARDSIRILSWLKANVGHAPVLVVANKVHPNIAEISRADFEASIERKISHVVPFDIKAATHAAKLGQTLAEANKANKLGAAIGEVAHAVLAAGDADRPIENAEKTSLLGKFDLKALLGRKEPKKAKVGAK
jgi:pilus assembly protein CpaE